MLTTVRAMEFATKVFANVTADSAVSHAKWSDARRTVPIREVNVVSWAASVQMASLVWTAAWVCSFFSANYTIS